MPLPKLIDLRKVNTSESLSEAILETENLVLKIGWNPSLHKRWARLKSIELSIKNKTH